MDVGWSGARWQTSNSCHLRNAFGFETPFSRDVLRPGIKISADIHGSIGSSPGAAPLMVSRSGRRQCSRTVTLLESRFAVNKLVISLPHLPTPLPCARRLPVPIRVGRSYGDQRERAPRSQQYCLGSGATSGYHRSVFVCRLPPDRT